MQPFDLLCVRQSFENTVTAPEVKTEEPGSSSVLKLESIAATESKTNPDEPQESTSQVPEVPSGEPIHYKPRNPQTVLDTATEMILSSNSALHGCSKEDAQRIVNALDAALPPSTDGDSGDFTDGLHKIVFTLQVCGYFMYIEGLVSL